MIVEEKCSKKKKSKLNIDADIFYKATKKQKQII